MWLEAAMSPDPQTASPSRAAGCHLTLNDPFNSLRGLNVHIPRVGVQDWHRLAHHFLRQDTVSLSHNLLSGLGDHNQFGPLVVQALAQSSTAEYLLLSIHMNLFPFNYSATTFKNRLVYYVTVASCFDVFKCSINQGI